MKPESDKFEQRDQIIAALLWYGTWFASLLIAIGMVMTAVGADTVWQGFSFDGYDVVTAGVAAFIMLPVARVALMLTIFARERDYVYVGIAALVLAIIAVGVIIKV